MILFLPAILLSLAAALFEAIRARRKGPAAAAGSLLFGGGIFLTAWLLGGALRLFAASSAARSIPPAGLYVIQGVLLAAAAFPMWVCLLRLTLYRAQLRDLLTIVPFAMIALIIRLAVPATPVGLAELVALPALARYRWRREVSSGVRVLTALFGFLFILLNLIPLRLSPPGTGAGAAVTGLFNYYDWVRTLCIVYLLGALPRILWGMELPIRSVKRRLLVSHLLAGAVPLVLLVIFWGLSTFLSVNGERARIAARYVSATSAELCGSLRRAAGLDEAGTSIQRSVDGSAADELAGWCRIQSGVWPGLRLWRRNEAGEFVRVYGAVVPGESALEQWPNELREHGVVLLAGRTYLGASCGTVGMPSRPLAVVLVPISDVLGLEFQKRFDATAHLETSLSLRPEGGFMVAEPDSSVQADNASSELATARSASAGVAIVHALSFKDGAWNDVQALLWVDVGLFQALRGLAQNLKENPFNIIPLIFLIAVAGLFVLVELLTIGMVVGMGRSILRTLAALRQGTARLRSGNFRYRIPIESNDELWEVAESFNDMAGDLDKARDLEIEKERLESELELARQIQSRLLPAELPYVPRFDLAGLSVPARHVGGDYYDVLRLGEDRLGLIAADVSGKGVPAALLMSSFRASLLSLDLGNEGPAETFVRLNSFVHRSVEPGRFVTAFLAVLHLDSGRLVYSNAGHNPPFLVRENGEHTTLKEGGLVLGLFGETTYDQSEAVVEPGDLLALYTDGVTEAADEEENLYGEERLLSLLERLRGEPCHEIAHEILGEVRAFSTGVGQADDITLLLARRRR